MFNKYVEKGLFNKINLDLIESFADSPNVALQNMKSRDINIIVGFFGPTNARRVLCQVRDLYNNSYSVFPLEIKVHMQSVYVKRALAALAVKVK